MSEEDKMPFTSHLEELRDRLIVCFCAIFAGFAVSYAFKEKLFEILARPLIAAMLVGEKMVYTSLPEAFLCYLKVALLFGFVLAMPLILYEVWAFVVPGLYSKERQILLPLVTLSCLFFAAGTLFCYFIVLPFAFKYLVGFASEFVRPLPAMSKYLGLASSLLVAFGLIFELPLVITVLARFGVVSAGFLARNRKYAILINFILAAVLTPTPDAFNQCLMAAPLIILYEVSIIGARIFGKKKEEDPEA